jgi:AraC-like DNA-binding protein
MEAAILYPAEKLDDIFVFQAEYHKFQFCRHSHEDFAFGLMFQGIQKLHCRGKCFYAGPGNLLTVNAEEVHDGMSADGGAYIYKIIYIPEILLQEISGEQKLHKGKPFFHQPVTQDLEIAQRLRVLFRDLDEENSDQLEIQSTFYSLVVTLLNRHGSGDASLRSDTQTPDAIVKACTFINDMVRHHITLDDIATAAGLSRYHFLRLFHSSCGMTPHSYLLQRRLQLARESLREGSLIADAAVDSGFFDQSHFAKRFKSAFGITPRQYQQAVC